MSEASSWAAARTLPYEPGPPDDAEYRDLRLWCALIGAVSARIVENLPWNVRMRNRAEENPGAAGREPAWERFQKKWTPVEKWGVGGACPTWSSEERRRACGAGGWSRRCTTRWWMSCSGGCWS